MRPCFGDASVRPLRCQLSGFPVGTLARESTSDLVANEHLAAQTLFRQTSPDVSPLAFNWIPLSLSLKLYPFLRYRSVKSGVFRPPQLSLDFPFPTSSLRDRTNFQAWPRAGGSPNPPETSPDPQPETFGGIPRFLTNADGSKSCYQSYAFEGTDVAFFRPLFTEPQLGFLFSAFLATWFVAPRAVSPLLDP